MFLTAQELIELTGRHRGQAQAKILRALGIEHKIRPDGRVLVLTTHINKEFHGAEVNNVVNKPVEPNWGAI